MASRDESSAPGTWILAVVGAMILGTAQRDFSGAIVGALLGYLLAQVWHLKRRIDRLTLAPDLAEASREPAAPSAAQGWAPAAPNVAPAPRPPQPLPAALPRPPIPARASPAAQPLSPPSQSPTPAMSTPTTTPTPSAGWNDRALAWLRGGNPVARLGIVILFFGAAFLARYAAEHSLVPIEVRFAFIALGAIALLGFGWRLRARRPVYAHLLQGGGIAGLYLTVFAATRLYALLPPAFALALMVIVAVTSALLAVAQESLPLAVIGTAGGFLAPILVATGSSNHVALFTYYAILNLGVFTVAWFRAWRVLNLVGFVFTFGIAGAFRATAYTAENMFSTDCFVILFFLMYVAISILFAIRQKPDLKGYVSASLVFGLPIAAFGLHSTLVADIEYAMAWSALALGGFYLLLALTLLRAGRAELRLLCEAFAALGVIFASLAVPLAFDQHTTAAMWAVEGAGLLWLGVRQQRRLARAFGALLQAFAGAAYLSGWDAAADAAPFLNSAYLGTVMLAVSGWLSGAWLYRCASTLSPHERGWEPAFALWGTTWWLGGGLAELQRAWPDVTLGAYLAFFVVSAALLRYSGERRDWPLVRHLAVLLLPLGGLAGLAHASSLPHPFAQAGAIGWTLLLVAHYAMLRRLEDDATSPLRPALPLLHASGAWLLLLIAAWELSWQIGQRVEGVWRHLPWGLLPAALLWLLGARPLRPAWPLAAHDRAYRVLAAAPVATVACVWVLAINLGSDGNSAPLPYLPLFNPLDVAVAITLLAVARWWLALDQDQRAALNLARRPPLFAATAALVFLWLNAALVRSLHWQAGTPLDAAGMAHSTVVQAALSIFWSLLGFVAMIRAGRRSSRPLWLIGAALMGVVVLKLFLVDTAGSGTLARIASFIVVGVLLLVTGYLSPLPPPPLQRERTA